MVQCQVTNIFSGAVLLVASASVLVVFQVEKVTARSGIQTQALRAIKSLNNSDSESDDWYKCCPYAICDKDDQGHFKSNWNDCFSTPLSLATVQEYHDNGFYIRTPDGMNSNVCTPASFIKGESYKGDPSAIWTPNQQYFGVDNDYFDYKSRGEGSQSPYAFDLINLGTLMKTDVGNSLRKGANYPHDSNACDSGEPGTQFEKKRENIPFGQHYNGRYGSYMNQDPNDAHCIKYGKEYISAAYSENGPWTGNWEEDMNGCYYTDDEMDSVDALMAQTQNTLWFAYIDYGNWDTNLYKNSFGAPQYWGWNEIAMDSAVNLPKNWYGYFLTLPANALSLQQLPEFALADAVQQLKVFWKEKIMGSPDPEIAKKLEWVIKTEVEDEWGNYGTNFFCQNFVFEWNQQGDPVTYMQFSTQTSKCQVCFAEYKNCA